MKTYPLPNGVHSSAHPAYQARWHVVTSDGEVALCLILYTHRACSWEPSLPVASLLVRTQTNQIRRILTYIYICFKASNCRSGVGKREEERTQLTKQDITFERNGYLSILKIEWEPIDKKKMNELA